MNNSKANESPLLRHQLHLAEGQGLLDVGGPDQLEVVVAGGQVGLKIEGPAGMEQGAGRPGGGFVLEGFGQREVEPGLLRLAVGVHQAQVQAKA